MSLLAQKLKGHVRYKRKDSSSTDVKLRQWRGRKMDKKNVKIGGI